MSTTVNYLWLYCISDIFRATILVSVLPLCYQNVLKYTISNTIHYFKNKRLSLGETSKS